jgi:AcrR family transcriptional regulator
MASMSTTSGQNYRGLPATERAQQRKGRLIDAALDLMGDGAWRAATVDALCTRAGLNKRYFYESFSNLDDVARAVVDSVAATVAAAALSAFSAHSPEEDLASRAHATLDAVIRSLVEDPRKAHTLFGPVSASLGTLEHRAHALDGLTALLVEHARTIHDVALEADSLATIAPAFLIGGTGEAVLAWLREPGHGSIERLVDDITTLWLLVGNGAATAARERMTTEPRG